MAPHHPRGLIAEPRVAETLAGPFIYDGPCDDGNGAYLDPPVYTTCRPLVYSFATILGAYLLATFAGSQAYRIWSCGNAARVSCVDLAGIAWPAAALDGRSAVPPECSVRVFLGVMPISPVIGFLTPMLVDRWSGGDPDRAGRAYAVNVAGCIFGPLVSGFILLPLVGEHLSMLLFVLPWFVMAFPSRGARAMTGALRREPLLRFCWPGISIFFSHEKF